MKIKTIIILLLPFTANAFEFQIDIFKNFHYENDRFAYSLILNVDSTFKYSFTDKKRGNTNSKGKWKLKGDTLFLFNYIKPYTITYGQEGRIDTLGNKKVVEVCLDNKAISFSHSGVKYFIDGLETSTKANAKNIKIPRIDVWINSLCNSRSETNDNGTVYYTCDSLLEINLTYDTYIVNNTNYNYFRIFLSNFPINCYPNELQWNKWLIEGNFAVPLECGEELDYLKLKAK